MKKRKIRIVNPKSEVANQEFSISNVSYLLAEDDKALQHMKKAADIIEGVAVEELVKDTENELINSSLTYGRFVLRLLNDHVVINDVDLIHNKTTQFAMKTQREGGYVVRLFLEEDGYDWERNKRDFHQELNAIESHEFDLSN